MDGNENGVAEPGEVLKYVISAKNTGTKAKELEIKDTLTELLPHIQGDPSTIDITIGASPYKLIDLINGVTVNVEAGKTVSVYFEVTLKEDFDTATTTKIKNIASVNGHTPEAEIPTGAVNLNTTKSVVDATGDQKAEAGEALTYTISVKNTGTVGAKNVLIQDDLINLMNHIKDPTSVQVMVGNVEHTLAELKNGIYRDLNVGEILITTFTVVLKDDFDAKEIKVLKNIATVGDEKPEVEIPTGYYEIKASKFVKDSSGDGYVEAGEALTYTIAVENTGNITANDLMIQDDLANLIDHIKDYQAVTVKVGAVEYTLEELISGINLDIKEGELVEFVFTIVLKDEFDAKKIKVLMNIAKIGDIEAEAKIDTFVVNKGILGEIKPKPDKPQGILGQVKPLPATGQSNQVMVGAALLVLLGIGLVVKKREEDE